MDSYFGIILFSWIVIAPTVGLFVLSMMETRNPRRVSSVRRREDEHAPDRQQVTFG